MAAKQANGQSQLKEVDSKTSCDQLASVFSADSAKRNFSNILGDARFCQSKSSHLLGNANICCPTAWHAPELLQSLPCFPTDKQTSSAHRNGLDFTHPASLVI
jgi:hypothetical protein